MQSISLSLEAPKSRLAQLHLPMLTLLTALCLSDALLTPMWLVQGLAEEANPLLAALWIWHPLAFIAVKFGATAAALPLVWNARPTLHMRLGTWMATLIYLGAFFSHIQVALRA